jgi:alkylation response protein AidB-like acyl-CoA dehydrogenase
MDFELTDEQAMLQKTVKQFSNFEIEPISAEIDKSGKLPDDLITKIAELGLFGMSIPKQCGGSEIGDLCCALAIEQMAYTGSGAWWLLAFNNSIPETIAHFDSNYSKKQYLKSLCDGTAYASIQFTEADTGSDPRALITRVKIAKNGYLVNGMKRFSTFGARAGYSLLFAKDEDDNCSAFVIQKGLPGYNVSKTWDLMGGGGIETVDIDFEDMQIPGENLLGKKGQGFEILLYWIAIEKIQQCAACVGMAQAALDEAIKFAKTRLNRGKPISDMQGIRWQFAEMYSKLQAARWLTYRAAYLKDTDNKDWMTEAAAAKIMVVPATLEIVETARRIHGAYGYTRELKIERLYRAIAGASAIAVSLEINKSIVGGSLVR